MVLVCWPAAHQDEALGQNRVISREETERRAYKLAVHINTASLLFVFAQQIHTAFTFDSVKMSASPLLQLPHELQTSILQHLSAHSALSLAATCAAAYPVVQPFVYANVSIHWPPGSPPRLDLLLRTLIHSSDNRKYVKSLHLRGNGFRKGSAYPMPVPALSIDALSIVPP